MIEADPNQYATQQPAIQKSSTDAIKVYSGDIESKSQQIMFKKEPSGNQGRIISIENDLSGLNEAQKQRRLMQIEEDRRNYYETDLKQF